MEGGRRSGWVLDVVGLLLLGWGLLLAYVGSPALLRGDLLADGGVSLIGLLLAVAHVAAAVGVARRHGWGRGLGIGLAAVGLFGSVSVLGIFLGGMSTILELDPNASLLFLAIPAGMAASYLFIFVGLVRSRDAFVAPA